MNVVTKLKNEILETRRSTNETLWGMIFNQTIAGSEWFSEPLSPGRWAVGYPFLYVLYRVLNDIRPRQILELGLGQSSKMTCSYANNVLQTQSGGAHHY